jgi:hypothetical protein
MSRRTILVAVAGVTGLAVGCYSPCGANRCAPVSQCGAPPVATPVCRDCAPTAGPAYYADPTPVGIPTSNGPRPENELPMPNQNIAPPVNPIPIGLPAAMPGKGK